MSMLKEYFGLYRKYCEEYGDKTILLYQVGAFYEVYTTLNESKEVTDNNIILFQKCTGCVLVSRTEYVSNMGFIVNKLDSYLPKILNADFTAIVYNQDKDEPNTTRSLHAIYSPGSCIKTEEMFSEGDSLSTSNNSMCIWIHNTGSILLIGVSTFDVMSGTSYIFQAVIEGHKNKKIVRCPTSYDELERYISTHNPSEIVIVSNMHDEDITLIVSYINLSGKKLHHKKEEEDQRVINAEKQIYQQEVMEECFGSSISNAIMTDANMLQFTYGIQCFVYLLSFLSSHSPNIISRIREPIFENNNSRMVLANHSLKQLNIVDDGNYSGRMSCVSSFLNCCVTFMGKRLFKYNILNPITDSTEIEHRYDMIDIMLEVHESDIIHTKVRNYLKNVMDIDKFYRQILLGKITPTTFYTLSQSLQEIKESLNYLMGLKDRSKIQRYLNMYLGCSIKSISIKKDFLDKDIFEMKNIREVCDSIYSNIERTLNLDNCKLLNSIDGYTNVFNEGVNDEIDNSEKLLQDSWESLCEIQKFYNSLVHQKENKKSKKSSTKAKNKVENGEEEDSIPSYVKIHETEKGGVMLQCTKRRGKILEEMLENYLSKSGKEKGFDLVTKSGKTINLPKQIQLVSISSSASSSTFNIHNVLLDKICHSLVNTKGKLKGLIVTEYKNYSESYTSKSMRDNINIVSAFVAHVDVMHNGAYVASKYGYSRPQVDNAEVNSKTKSYVLFEELRHPLIEHLNGEELYVTNDIGIGRNDEEKIDNDVTLLYGTNAVGKTSIIRAIGISIILAQSGLFVPCSKMKYLPYTRLFTRIIGNDNLFKGMSTFAVEMSELRVILNQTDERSIVLGDELCSGTEHNSAVNIFVSGIIELHNKHVSAIFATHLHEIVDYEEITNLKRLSMKHLTVRYDKEKDLLIYDRKLKEGSGDSMYGLEVCKSLHLPDEFLDRAYKLREKYDRNISNHKINIIMDSIQSKYNAKQIVSICEICNQSKATEVHHIIHQATANSEGLISGGKHHKNHTGNLVPICEDCHKSMHTTTTDKKQVETKKKRVLTNSKKQKKGVIITND